MSPEQGAGGAQLGGIDKGLGQHPAAQDELGRVWPPGQAQQDAFKQAVAGKGVFRFIGLPLKFRGGTGSPIRAVAVFEN